MTTLMYLLIAALIFFVIGYLVSKAKCDSSTDRYLTPTPIDPNTHDDGLCEEEASKKPTTTKPTVAKTDKKPTSTPKIQAVASKEVTKDEAMGTKPVDLLDAPRDGKKDNITRIKGIGLKIEENLNQIGVYHFDQIAAWTEENTTWADSELSFPGRAKREDWIGQAKLLAEGKETEFSQRVDKGEVSSSKKV